LELVGQTLCHDLSPARNEQPVARFGVSMYSCGREATLELARVGWGAAWIPVADPEID
jgi:hypothetical protein